MGKKGARAGACGLLLPLLASPHRCPLLLPVLIRLPAEFEKERPSEELGEEIATPGYKLICSAVQYHQLFLAHQRRALREFLPASSRRLSPPTRYQP